MPPHFIVRVLLFIPLLVYCAQATTVGEFTVTGKLAWNRHDPQNPKSVLDVCHYDFVVERRNREYRIHFVAIDGINQKNEIVGSDGIDNFFLRCSWPSWEDRRQNRNYEEFGTVRGGAFPSSSIRAAQVLWLLFCSDNHFDSRTNHNPIPLTDVLFPVNSMTNIVSWMPNNPMIVESLQAFSPNFRLVNGQPSSLPDTFKNGYLAYELNVISRTNFDTIEYPVEAQFKQYSPNTTYPSVPSTSLLYYSADISATSWSQRTADESLLPQPKTSVVRVADWRFDLLEGGKTSDGSTPVIAYSMTNGVWRSRADKGVKAEVVTMKKFYESKKNTIPRAWVRAVLLSAFAVLLLLLCWFFVREARRKHS